MAGVNEMRWRAWNYAYDSGVPWLMGGLVGCIGGGSGLISHRLSLYYQLIPLLAAIPCMLLVFWGAKQFSLRVIAPRGGYVEPDDGYHNPQSWALIPIALAGDAAIILTLRVVTKFDWGQLLWPGFAIFLAIMASTLGWQMKRLGMYWFALYLLLLASTLLWARVGPDMSWFFVGVGVPLAVLGGLRLRKFLKANPRIEESGESV